MSTDLKLNSHSTTRLSLTDCGIDDKAVACLAQGIKRCNVLEILELNCNSIGSVGVESLAKDNIHNLNLHTLNLSCNRIGWRGAITIARAVQAIKGLKLYLWNNGSLNLNLKRFVPSNLMLILRLLTGTLILISTLLVSQVL